MALADALTHLAPPSVPGQGYGDFERIPPPAPPVLEVLGEEITLEIAGIDELSLVLHGEVDDELILEVN